MFNDFRASRGGVCSRVLGISALIAILFVAGCSTSKKAATFAVTSSSLPAGSASASSVYPSTTLTASNGTAPYTWTVTSGNLPAGLALSGAGLISGSPTAAGTSNFTVQATDSATPTAHTATANLSITINPALAVTPPNLPPGSVGAVYPSTPLAATGGVGTLTWTLNSGNLPTGLGIGASGSITGTVASTVTPGPFSFTAKVTDSQSGVGISGTLIITVVAAPAITSFTPTPATITSGSSATLTAVFTNGTGSVNNSVGAVTTGTPATVSPTATTTYTLTVTNTANVSVTATATVTVDTAPAITSSNAATFSVGSNGTFSVTTTGTPAPAINEIGALPSPVTFVDNGNGTATLSGIPGVGTAGTYPITINATNGIGTPASQSFTLTVSNTPPCGSGSESLLSGQYAFTLRGFDAGGPVGIGGIFNADGTGKVATIAGIEDVNSNTGLATPTSLSIISANSSYSVGSDHRGCMTIATSAGTQMFRFSLAAISGTPAVASLGHMVEFDATGSNTAGELRLQNPAAFSTSAISGSYAFGASGPDNPSGKFAIVGLLTLSGGSVVTTGASPSVIDTNDNGNINITHTSTYPTSPVALSAGGSYSIGANGRGTLAMVVGGGTVNSIVYALSSTEFLILAAGPQSGNGLYVGSAMQQSGGPFSTSSLNAASILYTTGLGNNGGTNFSRVTAGILTPSGGNISFSGQQNNGGTLQAQTASGIAYAVATNGRVTFTGGGGGSNPLIYLVSPNKGFAFFVDSSTSNAHVESGFLEPQTGGPFGTSSASGTYAFGTLQPDVAGIADESGIAAFNSTGTPQVSVTSDNNSSGTLNPGGTFGPIGYSVDSTGLGVIPAGCSIDGTTGQDGTCQSLFYVLSPTKAVVIDATSSATTTNPHLQTADQ